MLISDQAKDLKIVLKAGAPSVLFYRWCTPGILHKSTVWAEKIIHVTIYVKKARVLRSNLTIFRPCLVWKYHEWLSEVLLLPRKYVSFTEGVDRQNSADLRHVVELVFQENFVPRIKIKGFVSV